VRPGTGTDGECGRGQCPRRLGMGARSSSRPAPRPRVHKALRPEQILCTAPACMRASSRAHAECAHACTAPLALALITRTHHHPQTHARTYQLLEEQLCFQQGAVVLMAIVHCLSARHLAPLPVCLACTRRGEGVGGAGGPSSEQGCEAGLRSTAQVRRLH